MVPNIHYWQTNHKKDKDGELTQKDLERYWVKVKKILTNNIPDASGFGSGFMFGLRGWWTN